MSSHGKMIVAIVAMAIAVFVNMLTVSTIAIAAKHCSASEIMP
ncbi:hypothetical protein C7451_12318 [Blastomonas natatoria]|uniref:Uncharacterized protein n=1 Tax=Blastomonas natatoria TaxID=34015 RepID=A0A2V3URK8_9SPHN|nr:hypothetical protein [Blastomonas natatoria]PXW67882.1 hypothetical protein C7451_12318 [Blastomonas natatoria]